MRTYVALFRGINVGGKNTLPMKELVTILEDLGADHVRTYIQSGNAVFGHGTDDTHRLATEIAAEVQMRHRFEPLVLLLHAADLERAVAANPFPEAESEPKTLHLFFLAADPEAPDLDTLTAIRKPSERFHLGERVFYLHAPDGIGRSKLAAGVEKALGVRATGRNWRSVGKIVELADGDRKMG